MLIDFGSLCHWRMTRVYVWSSTMHTLCSAPATLCTSTPRTCVLCQSPRRWTCRCKCTLRLAHRTLLPYLRSVCRLVCLFVCFAVANKYEFRKLGIVFLNLFCFRRPPRACFCATATLACQLTSLEGLPCRHCHPFPSLTAASSQCGDAVQWTYTSPVSFAVINACLFVTYFDKIEIIDMSLLHLVYSRSFWLKNDNKFYHYSFFCCQTNTDWPPCSTEPDSAHHVCAQLAHAWRHTQPMCHVDDVIKRCIPHAHRSLHCYSETS